MPKPSLFDTCLDADKQLGLKTGDFARAKKVLTPDLLENAVSDGVALYKRENRSADIYAHSVGLSRTRTRVPDMVEDLDGLIKSLKSEGLVVMKKRLVDAPATEVEGVKEVITRYAKLMQSVCADCHWYQNFLGNPHARKGTTEEQLETCRSMCRLLNISYKEC